MTRPSVGAYHSFLLLARSWLRCCFRDSSATSQSQCCLNHSMDLGRIGAQPTWSSQPGSFRRSAGSNIRTSKAFNTVQRELLWDVLHRVGCPSKFVNILRQFHDGMTARVTIGGQESEPFLIRTGVRQGCVLLPVLFSIFGIFLPPVCHQASLQWDWRQQRCGGGLQIRWKPLTSGGSTQPPNSVESGSWSCSM